MSSEINFVYLDDIFFSQFVNFNDVTPLCYNILPCKRFDKLKSFLCNQIGSDVFNKMCIIVNYKKWREIIIVDRMFNHVYWVWGVFLVKWFKLVLLYW